jgi:hypothetical protein
MNPSEHHLRCLVKFVKQQIGDSAGDDIHIVIIVAGRVVGDRHWHCCRSRARIMADPKAVRVMANNSGINVKNVIVVGMEDLLEKDQNNLELELQ